MAIRDILKMGNPDLLKVSEPVDLEKDELTTLIEDMKETMKANDGAGLAAPQIGFLSALSSLGSIQTIVIQKQTLYHLLFLLIRSLHHCQIKKENGWEGCLSVPGLRGVVPRYTHIKYEGYDAEGNKIEREVEDFHARVVQHEYDHLDGILYPMKIDDYRYFGFHEEIFKD